MAWWDDVLGLLRDEWKVLAPGAQPAPTEPHAVKQAQALLKRTTRELRDAQARAEASRRRMQRAQSALEALTREAGQHPRYQARLTELARALSHESDLSGSFSAHAERLGQLRANIERQLHAFERDLGMARTARAAHDATRAAAPGPAPARPKAGEPGFRRARPRKVMDRLDEISRRTGPDEG